MINIYCQICSSLIATASQDVLASPIHGSMFGVPYPERMDESEKLLPNTEWEFLKCPVCGHRPFLKPDMVQTDDGKMIQLQPLAPRIEQEPAKEFVCEICGKSFERKAQLRGHMLWHAKMRKHNGE